MYEVWLFAGVMGMWFCAVFLGIGIIVGRSIHGKGSNNTNNQGVDERQPVLDSNNVLGIWNGDSGRSDNSVDTERVDDEKEIIKYKDGKITNEYSRIVLEIMLIMMKNTLSATEKDAIQCAIDVLKLN